MLKSSSGFLGKTCEDLLSDDDGGLSVSSSWKRSDSSLFSIDSCFFYLQILLPGIFIPSKPSLLCSSPSKFLLWRHFSLITSTNETYTM